LFGSGFDATDGKANFEELYEQPDPRAYYRGLGALGYEVPEHGRRVFDDVVRALAVERPTIVDLCCSYGVNAALMKHHLQLDELYEHYCAKALADLPSDALAAIDRDFFEDHRRDEPPIVVGVDISAPAVAYAEQAGLLDVGFAENLEIDEPSPELVAASSGADLITVTGGVGYITERTFDRLMDNTERDTPPWVASLCLRTVSYDPVATSLAGHGLVTEQLEDVTFPQRQFADMDERDTALERLATLGIDPTGRESEGSYHVDVYVSRPAEEAEMLPIADLLAGLQIGADDNFAFAR
jgi:hypothetical protein